MTKPDIAVTALHRSVRSRIESGRLPAHSPSARWGGPGNNDQCTICWQPITQRDIGLDLLFATPNGEIELHMHRDCHFAWERERASCGAAMAS